MAIHFFDTSAIDKRYIAETGTVWVQSLADPSASHRIYLASITAVELTSAVIRRQRGGGLPHPVATAILVQFRQDWAVDYRVREISPTLLAQAIPLAKVHALRAYDAVQLDAALDLNLQRVTSGLSPVTLVCADRELNAAATASGLLVEDRRS